MANKKFGIFEIVLGSLIIVSDLFLGFFGWSWLYGVTGIGGYGFGWRKITLLILGVLLLITGIIMYIMAKKQKKAEK